MFSDFSYKTRHGQMRYLAKVKARTRHTIPKTVSENATNHVRKTAEVIGAEITIIPAITAITPLKTVSPVLNSPADPISIVMPSIIQNAPVQTVTNSNRA